MKIIGFTNVIKDFDTPDGRHVHTEGFDVYLAAPIPSSAGEGIRAERVYISDRKMPCQPEIGMELDLIYDRGRLSAVFVR